MTINVPSKIRTALYVITAVGTPFMAYLLARGVIGELEMTLWSAEVTVVAALAAFNVNPDKESK